MDSTSFPCPKEVSQGEFDHLIIQLENRFLNVNGQAPFNRLADVSFDLLHGLALGGAAGYRRDLGPEPSLLGFVDNHTDSHKVTFSLIKNTLPGQNSTKYPPAGAGRAGYAVGDDSYCVRTFRSER